MPKRAFKRKLTAILSADVEGYSRLMGEDEEATVQTLTAYREVMATLIQSSSMIFTASLTFILTSVISSYLHADPVELKLLWATLLPKRLLTVSHDRDARPSGERLWLYLPGRTVTSLFRSDRIV